MIPQNNNPPRPAQSFGSVQETFRYRLKNFTSGEQFSIVEDMPRSKPIRCEKEKKRGKDGGEFESITYLVKVVSRGIEADIEIYAKDLPGLAVLCPKGIENFKGSTFAYDGYNWSYLGVENIQTPQKDPRQPDLNPPQQQPDQRDVFVSKLVTSIQTLEALGNKVDASVVMKICDNISPGKGMDLFAYAKGKGAISENNGEWKAN